MKRSKTRLLAVLVIGALAPACAMMTAAPPPQPVGPKPEISPMSVLCDDPSLGDDGFCLPVDRALEMLRDPARETLYVKFATGGFSMPRVLYLAVPADGAPGGRIVFKGKWKPAGAGGEAFNNVPRKERAAYRVQTLFLEPEHYVVPPGIGECIPLDYHERVIGPAVQSFDGADCVYGLLAYWVENVTLDDARDLARFETDEKYARSLAYLNLLCHLIDHRDSRDANFLVAVDPERPRVFGIDNGLAFGGFRNPFTPFLMNFAKLHVGRLPRDAIERLRRLTRADLDASLSVIDQFEIRAGQLVAVEPTAPLDVESGVRRQGDVVQFGLTRREIDGVEKRLIELLERIDDGEIALF